MLNIPTPDAYYGDVSFGLEGSVYTFRYKWNSRNQFFYVTILREGDVLISGLRIQKDLFITEQYLIDGFPEGQFFIFKNSSGDEPIDLENFGIGKTFELYYYTEAENQQIISNFVE